MNITYKKFYCALAFVLALANDYLESHQSIPARVVLARQPYSKKVLLQSNQGFIVATSGKHPISRHHKQQIMSISAAKDAIVINDGTTKYKELSIFPVSGSFVYAGCEYSGSLRVRSDGKHMVVSVYGQQRKKDYVLPYAKNTPKNAAKHKPRANNQPKVHSKISEPESYAPAEKKPYFYNVRVLLDAHAATSSDTWHLESEHGFVLVPQNNKAERIDLDTPSIAVRGRSGSLFIDGHKYAHSSMYIVPCDGKIRFNGKLYTGSFLITHYQENLLLINSLEIEDYVYCVLKTESWPGWPLEVNKAFAIASRSYVIAMVMRAKSSKIPYHIKNTNEHQTYAGYHDSPLLKEAVEQTKGVFLAYNKQPIIAMFDICCGGVVPAKMSDVDFVKAPYLARQTACPYCKKTKMYHWQARYTQDEIVQACKQELSGLRSVEHIKIAKKDEAGLVKKLILQSKKGSYTLSGNRIRPLLQRIKSLYFTVTQHGNTFVFKGRGRGHHLGMCQWGAWQMGQQGFDYKEILDFYYPKTSFMRLNI